MDKMESDWLNDKRRRRRQRTQATSTDISDRLETGFAMLSDDDPVDPPEYNSYTNKYRDNDDA